MCAVVPQQPATISLNQTGLPHLLKIEKTQIYTGGQPQGEAGFASLAKLGVRTIINVDGAKPKLRLADKHGLRYVHIPIGYDGVDQTSAATLQSAAEEIEFPIYVHCHHGKHRGPAAAAIISRAHYGFTASQATRILHDAGTNPDYSGLWSDLNEWKPQTDISWAPKLVSVAVIDDFTSGMAELDRVWDRLKLIRASEWGIPGNHPDLVPTLEAEYFSGLLFESIHAAPSFYTDEVKFNKLSLESIEASRGLSKSISNANAAAAESNFSRLASACKLCHKDYRN